jgi:phosphoribosylamine---glycine ligase
MKVLVIGGGGREHAIIWKLGHEAHPPEVYCAPGNAGTALIAKNQPIAADDVPALLAWAQDNKPDLTIVGPEGPLAKGIVNQFNASWLPIFGPTKEAAIIESSKSWSKQFMHNHNIPHARGETFSEFEDAKRHIMTCKPPFVIKADGLAAGKGVVITHNRERAVEIAEDMMKDRTLGDAGSQIVIEEELSGVEVSVLAFSDGKNIEVMRPAQDYKRALDGDHGPNTGGMGAFAPSTHINDLAVDRITKDILQPTIDGLRNLGTPFKGVLYTGMIITPEGPKVLEYNARFGDPETQVIMPLLQTSLLSIMQSVIEGTLRAEDVRWSPDYCCGVVLASEGYPSTYTKAQLITGLDAVETKALVFQAGTRILDPTKARPQIITDGGRVLTVVAHAPTLAEARQIAYRNVDKINYEGKFHRTDIGKLHA